MRTPPSPTKSYGPREIAARFIVCCALLLAPVSVGWADADPKTFAELMEFVKKKASEVKAWSADVEAAWRDEYSILPSGTTKKQKITASGTRWRIETISGGLKIITVMDADWICWSEMHASGGVEVSKFDCSPEKDFFLAQPMQMTILGGPWAPLGQHPLRMLEDYDESFDITIVDTNKLDGVKVYRIEGTLKTGGTTEMGFPPGMVLRAAIGKKDGFVRKLELSEPNDDGDGLTMVFKNIKINIDVEDSVFVYTPPEGVIVEDEG